MRNWIDEIETIEANFFDAQRECNHGYKNNPNPYHLEAYGNIFGHTMAVYKEALTRYPEDDILQLACLLHDIGKPICKFEDDEKQRASFYNHENIGVFMAIGILNKLNIPKMDKIRVLELIQRHADSYKLSTKNLKMLYTQDKFDDILKIRICDTFGRISKDGYEKDIGVIHEAENLEFNTFTQKYLYPGTCTMLVGPPASGKSTYISENLENTRVLSRDNCLMKLVDIDDYSEAWNTVDQKEVDTLFQKEFTEIIKSNQDFVVDMTNMNVKSRRKITQRLKNRYNLEAIVFINSYSELLNRNSNRTGKVLNKLVIEGMCKRFQMIYPGEGFLRVMYII